MKLECAKDDVERLLRHEECLRAGKDCRARTLRDWLAMYEALIACGAIPQQLAENEVLRKEFWAEDARVRNAELEANLAGLKDALADERQSNLNNVSCYQHQYERLLSAGM